MPTGVIGFNFEIRRRRRCLGRRATHRPPHWRISCPRNSAAAPTCSPANPSPWATPIRWPTRSPTPILDAILAAGSRRRRVACETLVTTGQVVLAGEVTTEAYVDAAQIARDTIKEIGYIAPGHRLRLPLLRRAVGASTASRPTSPAASTRPTTTTKEHRRRRPGPDVRLRLRRDRRAHAAADPPGAPHRRAAGRASAERQARLAPPRRQEPGDDRVRERAARRACTPSSSRTQHDESVLDKKRRRSPRRPSSRSSSR